MQVTSITTRVVNAQMRNWVFVRVETDQPGLYGWGEATLEWKTKAVVGAVEDLAPLVIGRDPRDVTQAYQAMTKHSFWRLGVVGMSAVSGIEMALWDILGKALDQPVWRLLGGQARDRVKVYTHLGLGDMKAVYETTEAEPLVERAHAVVEAGYTALKAVFVPYTHYHAPLPEIDKVARLMEGLRSAVGDDVELMVDFHGRPASIPAALAYLEALAPFRPMFVEEPLPPEDRRGLGVLGSRSPVPLAAGERLVELADFAELAHGRGVGILQPDICHVGGLGQARKIAAIAEAAGLGLAPHNPLGPIAGAAALHFAVATPNHVIQEEMVGAVPWYDTVVKGPIERRDGCWQVPHAPGLGVEVDEAVCRAHPFEPDILHTRNAVLDDGTIVDW